jgi:hypothetical protein
MGLPYTAVVPATIISHTRCLKTFARVLLEHMQRAAFDKRLGKT